MKYCMRGGLIDGKEVESGNSPKNDIYDVKIAGGKIIKGSAGEIVMDKETLSKGPEAWVEFIKKEMKKNPSLFKTHFYDGGNSGDSYVDMSIAQGADPSWIDKLHDSLMNTPSTRYDASNRRINASSAREIQPKPKERPIVESGYAKGGAVEGGPEKVSVVMREFYKRKLHSGSGKIVKEPAQAKAIAMSEAGLSKSYASGGVIKENEHPMAEGGEVNNSITPENALNHYIDCDGICGGTVYDGSTDEKFLFGPYCFDIDKAREISKKQDNGEIEVSPLWLDKVRLNPEHAQKSKSKNPVFIAQIQTPNGLKPLLIDGNHRMLKAVEEKKSSIKAYIFSAQETASLFVAKPDGVEHPKDEGKQKFKDGGTVQPDFNPDKFLSDTAHHEFNPDEFLKKTGPQETSTSDKLKTAAENYGQALTLGYLPQIQAATEPALAKVYNAVTGENVETPDYVTRRDENIRRIEQESERNPKSALAGQATGIVAGSAMTPGLGAARGAGLISNAARGAAAGAAYGAVQNPGDNPGVVDPIQMNARIENAKTGAELGAPLGITGAILGKGLGAMKNSASAAQEFANIQAVRAAGGMKRDVANLLDKNMLDDVGKFALDNKIVSAGDSVKDVAAKADVVRKSAGEALDKVYSTAKDAFEKNGGTIDSGFNPVKNKSEILSSIKKEMGISPDKKSALTAAENYLDQLGEHFGDKELDPKTANNIKTELDKSINYNRRSALPDPAKEQAYSYLRTYINDSVKNHVEELGNSIGDKSLADKLVEANKKYGMSQQLQNMASDRVAAETANRAIGLTDTIAGGAGAATGAALGMATGHGVEGALAGLGAGIVNKLGRKMGPSTMASSANRAAPILEKTAVPISEFLARSPKDLATKAAIQELMLNRRGK